MELNKFGKQHWSLLLYFHTRCMNHNGRINKNHLRINDLKRNFTNGNSISWKETFSTKDNQGKYIQGHDDIDIMNDLIDNGLIKNLFTELNPIIKIEIKGNILINDLYLWKQNGKNLIDYHYGKI